MTIKILAISGALRAASTNTALLRAAQQLAPEGVEIEIYEGARDLPYFDQDLEGEPPASVVDLRERIAAADGVLIATPEYNYSIPGVLKNLLDWASRPYGESVLTDKPVAIMGASMSGFGTVRAQNHLRDVFHWLDSKVVTKPEVHVGQNHTRFDEQGNLTDETSRGLIAGLIAALVLKVDRVGVAA
ncbi:NAD(P)H-dependent oxidoreductase [Nocardia panacis]|uniref:NAD(P)H-dependent oxidoreductase n=1 Tax=Nocardia panacis TaxID=2340916 RepID=A0A3A4K7P8_9NOCA|nr:NADPH-dependent FMN reductase [Nocardia panacis]RJO75054.1 NAD(P)H-dependent oxidoreductase [Nocardia panacis]